MIALYVLIATTIATDIATSISALESVIHLWLEAIFHLCHRGAQRSSRKDDLPACQFPPVHPYPPGTPQNGVWSPGFELHTILDTRAAGGNVATSNTTLCRL